MVRLALQQLLDSVELPIGETERSMERLFGDRGQKSTLDARPAAARRAVTALTLRRGPPSRSARLISLAFA